MTRRQQVLGSLSSYADIVISLRSRYRSLHEAYSVSTMNNLPMIG